MRRYPATRFRPAPGTAATLTVTAAVAACLIAGCGSTAGPLQYFSVRGQPFITGAGSPVVPGQTFDATTYVVNTAPDPVTLISASVVPVPGFPAATLKHVAVNTTWALIGAGRGWPPQVPVRTFAGAKLGHGETPITFAISGRRTGVSYAAAGIRITYSYQGQHYTVIAWSAAQACVMTSRQIYILREDCSATIAIRLFRAVHKMAG